MHRDSAGAGAFGTEPGLEEPDRDQDGRDAERRGAIRRGLPEVGTRV
jgi:hypothetical protein